MFPLVSQNIFFHLLIHKSNKSKAFNISSQTDLLDKRLLSIKPPHIIGRFPRSLTDSDNWKATELKNWLFHYSLPVMYNILPPEFTIHWSLLVSGIAMLCSEKITEIMLTEADQMLHDFIVLIEPLYGHKKCRMNAHILQHLVYYVRRRGALWCYSCFSFEGFNAFIKALVHGTHHAATQIACALGLTLGIKKYVRNILASPVISIPIKNLLKKLSGVKEYSKGVKTKVPYGNYLGKANKSNCLDEDKETFIKLSLLSDGTFSDPIISYFGRFVADNGQMYYSHIHSQSKKINSAVIEYNNEHSELAFGIIQAFLKVEEESTVKFVCLIHKLTELDNSILYHAEDIDLSSYDDEVKTVLRKYAGKTIHG